ncbi:MAG: RNA polymerase subunit sigma-24 [Chlorobiaceae bacterium]|nr:RNA polymerase subunit sigma-24 [Chlorobiaceae bacterium]
MATKKRNPMELLDDIYNIAFLMTGYKDGAYHLVYRTYLKVNYETSEKEVFKALRDSFIDCFINSKIVCIPQTSCKDMGCLGEIIIRQESDVKLTVLLSEISGLKPDAIAKVIGVRSDTIRLWLSSGRKWLFDGSLSWDGLFKPVIYAESNGET